MGEEVSWERQCEKEYWQERGRPSPVDHSRRRERAQAKKRALIRAQVAEAAAQVKAEEARVVAMLEALGIHEAPAESDDPFAGDV